MNIQEKKSLENIIKSTAKDKQNSIDKKYTFQINQKQNALEKNPPLKVETTWNRLKKMEKEVEKLKEELQELGWNSYGNEPAIMYASYAGSSQLCPPEIKQIIEEKENKKELITKIENDSIIGLYTDTKDTKDVFQKFIDALNKI
jgi:hypothetical protein